MTLEIYYDKAGNPKSVLLSYDEYERIITKNINISNSNDIAISEKTDMPRDLREYESATGYYDDDTNRFWVLKGSAATGIHTRSFKHEELFSDLVNQSILYP